MSFSGASCGVPLTNILPKAVLPLTDASDSYGARKTTSLSQQASCADITAKLLLGFFFPPPPPRTERREARATNKRKEGVERNHEAETNSRESIRRGSEGTTGADGDMATKNRRRECEHLGQQLSAECLSPDLFGDSVNN